MEELSVFNPGIIQPVENPAVQPGVRRTGNRNLVFFIQDKACFAGQLRVYALHQEVVLIIVIVCLRAGMGKQIVRF